MHGVQHVRLVVVSPLVMAHVNRDWCVEGGEDVVGSCKNRKAHKKRELDEEGREWRLQKKSLPFKKKKKKFQRQKGYNKATRISEQAEHFCVKYWHYHTREVE